MTRQLSVTISEDMLLSLPQDLSSMFLNDAQFVFNGITILLYLLNHLNPYSSENILLVINNPNHLGLSWGIPVSATFLAFKVSYNSPKGYPWTKLLPSLQLHA